MLDFIRAEGPKNEEIGFNCRTRVYEPDEAERVSTALLSEANKRSHTAMASSTVPISRAMGKPLGTGQLKGWIKQSGQPVGHS